MWRIVVFFLGKVRQKKIDFGYSMSKITSSQVGFAFICERAMAARLNDVMGLEAHHTDRLEEP